MRLRETRHTLFRCRSQRCAVSDIYRKATTKFRLRGWKYENADVGNEHEMKLVASEEPRYVFGIRAQSL